MRLLRRLALLVMALSPVVATAQTPAPIRIGNQASGSFGDATGHSGQSHLVYAPNAGVWWLFTLSSAHDSGGNHTVQCYFSSGPDLTIATWTAAAASPDLGYAGGATNSLLAGGRSLGVALLSIGGTDYVHVFASAATDGQASSNGHIRAQLGRTSIAWGTWNNPGSPNTASQWQGPVGTGGSGSSSHTPWGNAVGISTGGYIHHFSVTMDQEVDCNVGSSPNADTAASWTNGFGTNALGTSPPNTTAVIDKTMTFECKALVFAPLASNVMLAVYSNGAVAQPNMTNLRYQKSGAAGAWTNVSTNNTGGNGNVFGSTATINSNDWSLVSVSPTAVDAFRRNAAGTGVDAAAYNAGGNSWAAMSPGPPPFGTGQFFKSGGGLFGATDGTNIWLFVINTDTANSILYSKFNGTVWTAWATVPGTATGTHTRNFIAGYPTVSSHQIGLVWTEGTSTFDVMTTSLGLGGDTTPPTATMTAPASGATVSGSAVAVSANAADNVGVVGVQFRLDGANLGAEVTAAPYATLWNTLTALNGSHQLTAVARDAAGNSTAATAVSVTVNNDLTPPAVTVIAPANGDTVWGTVAVSANATDTVGVVGVQFKLDGVNLGPEVAAAPYALSWTTLTAPDGSHQLAAVARDAAGNSTTAAPITVTVDNRVTEPGVVQSVTTGAARLLNLQNPDGGWFFAVGDSGCGAGAGVSCPNTIGTTALALLADYSRTGSAALLAAAVSAGNALVAQYRTAIAKTTPARPYGGDLEFLVSLAQLTGDSTYSTTAQSWFQVIVDQFPNAADRVDAFLASRDTQHVRTIAAWDTASLIRDAKAVGSADYALAAATRIRDREADWKDTDPAHRFDQCVNPSGCGPSDNPLAFDYTILGEGALLMAFHDLPGFAAQISEYRSFLLGQQDPGGSWDVGDLQITSYAVLGLAAVGGTGAAGASRSAVAFIMAHQFSSGGFPSYVIPGATGGEYTEVDAEVIRAVGTLYSTPTGVNVSVTPAQLSTVTFSTVTTSGATTVVAIDNSTATSVTGGFAVVGGLTYEVSTTASISGSIIVCFGVPWTATTADFDNVRIMHGENGVLVDRTILTGPLAPDFAARRVCALVFSLSPFAVAIRDASAPADTTPPRLAVTLSPSTLWPPDRRMVSITATLTVTDDTDPAPAVTLVSITSSEPAPRGERGAGTSAVEGAVFGTDDRTFWLRAERSESGPGRVYTVVYRAKDRAGNASDSVAYVIVPRDMAGRRDHDSDDRTQAGHQKSSGRRPEDRR